MKKMTIFKIAMSLTLALLVGSAFGQTSSNTGAEWQDFTANVGSNTPEDITDDGVSRITVTKPMPFMVLPDAVFLGDDYDFIADPNEDASNNVLTSSWTWESNDAEDFSGGAVAGVTINRGSSESGSIAPPAASAGDVTRLVDYSTATGIGSSGTVGYADNFVELTAANPGVIYLRAQETANGGCAGTYSYFKVAAFPRPFIYFEDADDDNYDTQAEAATNAGCGDWGAPFSLAIHLEGVVSTSGFDFNMNLTITNVDGTDTQIGGDLVNEDINAYVDNSNTYVSADADLDLEGTGTTTFTYANPTAFVDDGTAGEYTLTADYTPTVRGSLITKYVFTVNNVNDEVSRKSDYWTADNFTDNAYDGTNEAYDVAAAQTITLYALPAPTTGNIYHIPN